MAKPNLSNREPMVIETSSAVAFLTSYRSDLSNSITATHTSANLLTLSCTLAAAAFSGPFNGTVGATTANTGAFTTLSANGVASFTGATASTTVTNGTLVVTGGVGIGGALNVGNWITTIANLGVGPVWPSGAGTYSGSMGWNFNATNELGFMNNYYSASPNSFQFFQRTAVGAFNVLMTISTAGVVTSLGGFSGNFTGNLLNSSGWLYHNVSNAGVYPTQVYGTYGGAIGWNFASRNEICFMNNYASTMDSFQFVQRTAAATYSTLLTIAYNGGVTIPTASAKAFLTSTRTDLANSVTFTHTSSGLITFSGTFAVNALNLASKAASTIEGDVWKDSTQKSVSTFTNGIQQQLDGTIWTMIADAVTLVNGTASTMLGTGVGTLVLPANFFAAGKTIQVTVEGFYALANGGGANTLTVVLNAGTPVTIGTTAKQSLTGAGQSSTGRFQFNLTITARSATTIMVSGDYTAVDASGVLQTTIITNTTVATIVAGTSYTLDLRSTSDTIATGTYALTSKTGTVKIIN